MRHFYSAIFFIILLGGCAQNTSEPYPTLDDLSDVHYDVRNDGNVRLQKTYRSPRGTRDSGNRHQPTIEEVPVFDRGQTRPLSFKGNKRKQDIYVDGDKVKIAVENIPINEFIDLVLGGILKLNYSVTPKVQKMKDAVSLNMQTPQDAEDFYKVFKELLAMHGIVIRNKKGVRFVEKAKKGKKKVTDMSDLYIGYGRKLPRDIDEDKKVMMFVPYHYIKPQKAVPIIKEAGIINLRYLYTVKGMQTIVGSAKDVRKALQIIKMLDRPSIEGKTPYLISLDSIDAKSFVDRLKKIFKLNGIDVVSTPSSRGIVLMPIEELNMVYVISPKKSWIRTVMYWKKKLDRVSEEEDIEPRLYIYHVKNRKADELADAINNLLEVSRPSNQHSNTNTASVKDQTKNKHGTKNEPEPMMEDDSFVLADLDYKPSITADKDTNILMLKLLPSHYRILLPFIKELDKLPLQTLVEVTVAEVTMTDNFSLGFEYAIRNYKPDIIKETLDVTGGGSGLGVVFRGNYIDVTINALAKKQLLNIVSRPKMLIMNNNTGTINVGTQVPIVTSEVSASDVTTGPGGTPTINRNITYRTTGINLGVTPTINSNGILTLKIIVSLSEAQLNDTSGIDSPLIVNRDLSTVAVIRSGDTILIGGLISKNKSAERGGVPVLKDIPYVGDMFASQSDKTTKTELIMLIRPRIIKSADEMVNISYRYKKVLEYMRRISL